MGEFCAPKASLTLGSSYISVIVHGITPNVSITKETIPVSTFRDSLLWTGKPPQVGTVHYGQVKCPQGLGIGVHYTQ